MLHESRPSGSWLIFDVGQNTTSMRLRLFLLSIAAAGLCGCPRADRFDASGMVDHPTINSFIREAASIAKTEWRGGGGGGSGGVFRAQVEIDGEVDEVVRAQFMSSLRLASQKLLADRGATIHGWSKQGNDDNLVGFSWEYTWKENNGLMRIRYYPGPAARGHLAVFCYEHRRDATKPPRAAGY